MFKSFELKHGDWYLIDDDFECVASGWSWLDLANEYNIRKLDVGINLALMTIWQHQNNWVGSLPENIKEQNLKCNKKLKNWPEIAFVRDKFLEKMIMWI